MILDDEFEEVCRAYDDTRKRRQIRLVPFNQIKVGTERRYLIKGLIPRTGLTVVWGPPKSGKSFWTSDAVLHVALDWQYRGRRVHHGPVVYCAFEGATGFQARIEAFRKYQLPEDAPPVPFYLVPVTLNLVRDQAQLIEAIEAEIGDIKPVAVVLDTLNRSLEGSESSDQDMTAYVQACDAIREAFNCAVVIVHHCGIDGTRPRGHTSLTGAADTQLAVKRPNQAGPFSVTVEYMKDGSEGDSVNCDLEQVEVGTDEDGDIITSCIVKETDAIVSTSRRSDLNPRQGNAYRALTSLVAERGEPAPACMAAAPRASCRIFGRHQDRVEGAQYHPGR